MKMKFVVAAAMAAGLSLVGIRATGQDKPAANASAASQLSPEMQKLAFYVGEWDYVENYEKTKIYPDGAQDTGVYSSTVGPGGKSLMQHFHSKGSAGEFDGLIMMTFDSVTKEYKGYVFGSDYQGCIIETGKFEDDVLVFRTEFSMGPQKISTRNTAKVTSPGKLEGEEFVSVDGKPEKLFMKVSATKR
jgi:hypothetical protein